MTTSDSSYQYDEDEDEALQEHFIDDNDHFGISFNRYTFCQRCGNLLTLDTSEDLSCFRFACPTCPFFVNVTKRLVTKCIVHQKKKVVEEDIIDQSKADEHRQRTEVICPECSHNEAFFYQMQTRSADEPMTNFYQCTQCKHNWRTSYATVLQESIEESRRQTKFKVEPKNIVGMNNSYRDSESSSASTRPSVIRITSADSLEAARTGGQVLKEGGIIATPTDTVYGLAADAQNIQAVQRIYEIKGRNPEKPIAICLSQISQLSTWAKVTVSDEFLRDFLPGPVTLVFERHPSLNRELNPETSLIGIRIPNYNFIRELAEAFGGPVALTSANRSSEPSTLSPNEFQDLWPYIDCIFDGGHILTNRQNLSGEETTLLPNQEPTIFQANSNADEKVIRAGSTVINLSQAGYYSIIREGSALESCVQLLRNKYHLIEKRP